MASKKSLMDTMQPFDSSATVGARTEPEVRRRETRKLILDRTDVPAFGVKVECPANEGRQAILNFDHAGLLLHSFGVEVIRDQAGLRPPGEANIYEVIEGGVESAPSLHFEPDESVSTFPDAGLVARVTVRHAGLTEHAVLVEDILNVFRFGHGGQKALIDGRERFGGASVDDSRYQVTETQKFVVVVHFFAFHAMGGLPYFVKISFKASTTSSCTSMPRSARRICNCVKAC